MERFWVEALVFAGTAFAVSYGLTRVAIRVLPRMGLVSTPDPNHPQPVPLSGGIAVGIAAGFSMMLLGGSGHDVGDIGLIFLGATALFVAGVWDDVRLLEPRTKLLIQLAAASAMVISGVTFPFGPGLTWLAVPVTVLWFVGVCNAFNLVDNMDGMLPGVAAVAATFVGLFALATGRPETAIASWIVAGACAGFLRFNLPPARIFLGDTRHRNVHPRPLDDMLPMRRAGSAPERVAFDRRPECSPGPSFVVSRIGRPPERESLW